ncbi:MAG: hypothetical protein ACKOYJ_11245 [Planctomycetia bacterium]
MAPEWQWLESGRSCDLSITGNRIEDCPTHGIVVQARDGNGWVSPAGGHRNIRIVGNSIRNVALPCILCTSTDGLELRHSMLSRRLCAEWFGTFCLVFAGTVEIPPMWSSCCP